MVELRGWASKSLKDAWMELRSSSTRENQILPLSCCDQSAFQQTKTPNQNSGTKQQQEGLDIGLYITYNLCLFQLSSEEHTRCWCTMRTDALCTFRSGFNKITKDIVIVKKQMYWKSHSVNPLSINFECLDHILAVFCLAFLSWTWIDYDASTFFACVILSHFG